MTVRLDPLPAPAPASPAPGDPRHRARRWQGWDRARACLPLVALLVLTAALRLVAFRSAYETAVDEIVYARLGSSVLAGHLPPLLETGQPFLLHPPGFFLLEAGWTALFGPARTLYGGVYLDRLLGIAIATVTAGLLYTLGRRLADRRVGFLAGLLFALDPFVLRQNARVFLETPTVLWILLGYLVLLGAAWQPGRRGALRTVASGVLFGMAVLTKDMSALLGAAPVLVLAVLGRGVPVRRALLVAVGTTLPYLLALVAVAQQGLIGTLSADKTFGLRRLLGLVQVTGFNRAGSPPLSTVMMSQVGEFLFSYLLPPAGVVAGALLLASRSRERRLVGGLVASGVLLLGYATLFGTIEENFLYFLSVPSCLGVVLAADEARTAPWLVAVRARAARWAPVRWSRLSRLPAGRLAVGLLAVVCLFNSAVWAGTRARPDNGYERLATWAAATLPAGTVVAATSGNLKFALQSAGMTSVPASFPSRLAHDHVRYLALATREVEQRYTLMSPREAGWFAAHSTVAFRFTGPSTGTLVVYRTTDEESW